MTTLDIHISRRHLPDKKLKFKAAKEFNQLTRGQLIKLSRLIFLPYPEPDKEHSRKNHLFEIERKTLAMKILFGLKSRHLFYFTSDQLAWMNTYARWVFDGQSFLTDNKVLTIRTGWFKKLHGPIGDFQTLKAAEWTDADSAYLEYLRTADEKELNNLIAILYRPRNKKIKVNSEDYKGDIRIPYNSHSVEKRAKKIARLNPGIKYSILLWYRGCRKEWEDMFDKVFEGGTKEQVENYGWQETIQKVSGKAFGSMTDTEETLMYKILLNMQIEIKDHLYWKQKSEQQHGKAH